MMYQQAQDVFTGFSLKYGSNLPFSIEAMETGVQLAVPFRGGRGVGNVIVRRATSTDLRHPEAKQGEFVLLVSDGEDGETYSLRAGAPTIDEIVEDMVKIYTSVAGASTDAESAEV